MLSEFFTGFFYESVQSLDGILRGAAHSSAGDVFAINDQSGNSIEFVLTRHLCRFGNKILHGEGLIGVLKFFPIETLFFNPLE